MRLVISTKMNIFLNCAWLNIEQIKNGRIHSSCSYRLTCCREESWWNPLSLKSTSSSLDEWMWFVLTWSMATTQNGSIKSQHTKGMVHSQSTPSPVGWGCRVRSTEMRMRKFGTKSETNWRCTGETELPCPHQLFSSLFLWKHLATGLWVDCA